MYLAARRVLVRVGTGLWLRCHNWTSQTWRTGFDYHCVVLLPCLGRLALNEERLEKELAAVTIRIYRTKSDTTATTGLSNE